MSLHAKKVDGVPEETARVARAAFPKGSLAMRIRDELGELFSDADFAELYPRRGKLAWSPGRLALVSVMQFAEGLSDRQAADAVRGRLDWKYLLGLELADPGFDHSVLTEFRDRLIAGDAGMQLLDRVLEAAVQHDLLKAGGRARTDSMIVLAATRQVNGLVRLGETLRAALNSVEGTVCAPGRCRRHDLPGRPSLRPAGCRYSGLAKARLQHQLTATAMNFHRLNAWWTGIPRAGTRTSHLAALRP